MKIYFDYGTGWEDVTRYIRDDIKVTQRAGTDDFHYAQNVCNLTMMMDSSPFVPTTSGMLYYNDSFTSDSEWVVTVSEDTNIYTRGGVRNTTVFNIQPNIKYLVRLELTANQASNISLIGKTSSGTYRIIGNSTMVKGTNIVSFMVESDVQIVELGLVWDSLIPIEITKMYVGDWKWVSNYDKLKNADEVKVKVVDEWNTTNKISVYDKSDFTSDTEWTLTIAEDVLPSTRGGVYNTTAINLSANTNYLVSVDIYAEKSSNIYFIGKNVSGNWEIIGNSTMVAGWQTVEMKVNNPIAFTNIGFVWDIVSVEFTRIAISNIGGKTLFTGIISNKPSIPYDGMYELLQLQLEATDRVRKLEVSPDEIVLRNAKIADYTNKSQSIIHQLAYNAGFTNADIADFTINTTISGFATISGSDSILSIMDTLLYENGFVLHMDENDTIKPIQWILPSGTTPVYTFTGRDIFPALEYSENEKEYNKVEVTYYNVGEKPNVLLYKHSVPEDSNGLFTGYPVISGYYYPIEANIINDETGLREEVWFEYQDTSIKALTNKAIVEKLDYDPRTAMKAFKSDYSAIICTSGHYLDYRADAGLDLLSQTFKNNKAQVLFKNNTSESKKIYYLNLYGNVLYKTAERKTTVGEDLTKKKTNAYTSKYVYDSLTAKNLAVGLYQISQNNGTYTFSSFVDVPIGSYVYLNVPRFETYGIVLEKTYDILNGIFNYKIRQWQSVNTQVSTSIISNQDINTTNFLKLSILSRWCAIYDELDVTTVLTDDISHFVQGQYCSTIQSAKNVGVAVSDMQDYIDAVNQLRDYLWNPSTGILKYSTIISDEQSTADTYFATCTSKYNNLLNAINYKVQQNSIQQGATVAPRYLGAHLDTTPTVTELHYGDTYLRYSENSGNSNRGVFFWNGTGWQGTTEPSYIFEAIHDIVFICTLIDDNTGLPKYGTESEYGITNTMEVAHIMAAFIDRLKVGDLVINGILQSPLLDTVPPQFGETISTPTPTYWYGNDLATYCNSLSYGTYTLGSDSLWNGETADVLFKSVENVGRAYIYTRSDDVSTTSTSLITYIDVSGIEGHIRLRYSALTGSFKYIRVAIYIDTTLIYYKTLTNPFEINYFLIEFDVSLNQHIIVKFASVDGSNVTMKFIGLYSYNLAVREAGTSYVHVIAPDKYYNNVATLNIPSVGTWQSTSYDNYFKGSQFLDLFTGKLYYGKLLDVSGTVGGNTINGIKSYLPSYLELYYNTTLLYTIQSDGYYTVTGSITLPAIEGKILLGNPDAEGQYELWSHNIPTTTNNILTIRNIKSGKTYSIWEVRAPDSNGSGTIEATIALHNVYGNGDFVSDRSMHNYSGYMRVIDAFYNFGSASNGDIDAWEWWAKKASDASEVLKARLEVNSGNYILTSGVFIPAMTSGNYVFAQCVRTYVSHVTSYTKYLEYKIQKRGSVYIKCKLSGIIPSNQSRTLYYTVYKNGSSAGTEHSITDTAGEGGKDVTLTAADTLSDIVEGDLIQVYVKCSASDATISSVKMYLCDSSSGPHVDYIDI